MQYSIQGLNCEDPERKDLLMDIGTEELSHLEIVGYDDAVVTELLAQKAVEDESKYFDSILAETEAFRREIKPLEVEKSMNFEIGGVPISCRLDLLSDETICHRVEDLKRQGSAPPAGSAAVNRQLVTYAVGTGVHDVGLACIVENKKPKVVREQGQVSAGEIARVTRQYQVAARQITHAMETGDFMPVDHGDRARAWICSAKFCGAWKIGAKDWITGKDITCPFGQKATVTA